MSIEFACPVCGYADLGERPRDDDGWASFEICSSCGTEFGYDDATVSHAELRKRWLSGGCIWWATWEKSPSNWDAQRQLEQAGLNGS
jgi:predicted RNA-binding Zn-ribbon protein involved in translation (DUF1610 family)